MALSNGVRVAIGAGGAMVAVVAVVLGLPLVAPPPAGTDVAALAAAPPGVGDGAADPAGTAEAEGAAVPPTDVTPPALPAGDGAGAAAVAGVQPLSLAPPSMVPVFDVVRIEPDGTGVVAGQALAGMTVAILIDDAAVVETVADASGRFVDFLTLAPSDKPRVLSLVADPDGAAVLSSQSVVIAPTPPGAADGAGAVALSGDAAGPEGAETGAVVAEGSDAEGAVVAEGGVASAESADAADGAVAEDGSVAEDGGVAPTVETAGAAPADPVAVSPSAAADPVVGTNAPREEVVAATDDLTAGAVATGAAEASLGATDPGPGATGEAALSDPALADDGPTLDETGTEVAAAGAATVSETGPSAVAADAAEGDLVEASAEEASAEDASAEEASTEEAEGPKAEVAQAVAAVAGLPEPGSDAAEVAEAAVPEAGAVGSAVTETGGLETAGADVVVAGADGATGALPAPPEPLAAGGDMAAGDMVGGVVPQAPVADADAPPTVVAEIVPVAPAPVTSGAPPVLMVDDAGVRVLQPARTPVVAPELLRTVALDAISYDDSGDVAVSGRATSAGTVRMYLDNALLGEAAVQADGSWRLDLQGVPPGLYTLRADQVSTEGAVLSRIETPFLREERDTIAAVMAEDTAAPGFNVAVRTVQPGNTLWAIARDRYGEGILYVAVFEANQDLIRDPDLIYPGQVFRLPNLDGTAPE